MPDTEEWVEITHAASADEPAALVTKKAFELLWKDKGWKAKAKTPTATTATKEKN